MKKKDAVPSNPKISASPSKSRLISGKLSGSRLSLLKRMRKGILSNSIKQKNAFHEVSDDKKNDSNESDVYIERKSAPLENIEINNVDSLMSNMEILGSPASPKSQSPPSIPEIGGKHDNKENRQSSTLHVALEQRPVDEDTGFELRSSLASYTPSNSSNKSKYSNDGDEYESDCSTAPSSPPIVLPPISASKKEISNFYWEMCYGPNSCTKTVASTTKVDGSWSEKRAPPVKSCLSSRKKSKLISPRPTSPQKQDSHVTPPSYNSSMLPTSNAITQTPKVISFSIQNTSDNPPNTAQRNVKFGSASAAEFDCKRPALELTPLPKSFAEERYKLEEKVVEEEEEEMNEATKLNNNLLSSWEQDFDSFLDSDDDDGTSSDDEYISRRNRRRGRGRRDRKSSIGSRRRSCGNRRRSSTIFSRNGGSLVDPDEDSHEDDEHDTTVSSETSVDNYLSPLTVDCNNSPLLSPLETEKSRRRSSALFESVNRSGAFSSSPEDGFEEGNNGPESKMEKDIAEIRGQQTNETDLKPNQLDNVLKKYAPQEAEKVSAINSEVSKLMSHAEHEIDCNLFDTLKFMTQLPTNLTVKQALEPNDCSEKTPISLISHFLQEKMEPLNLSIKSTLALALKEIQPNIPHIHKIIQEKVSDAITTMSNDNLVDIDEIVREEFLTDIFPYLDTEEVQPILFQLFRDVYNIALGEFDEWEKEHIWQPIQEKYSRHMDECEEGRISLGTQIYTQKGIISSLQECSALIEKEESSIQELNYELQMTTNALYNLQRMETIQENIFSQLNHNLLSKMVSYSVKTLAYDHVELLFPRNDNDSFLSKVLPFQTSFHWSRCTKDNDEIDEEEEKWCMHVETHEHVTTSSEKDTLRNTELASHRFFHLYMESIFHKSRMKVNSSSNDICQETYESDIQASILKVDTTIQKIIKTTLDVVNVEKDHFCQVLQDADSGNLVLSIVLKISNDHMFPQENNSFTQGAEHDSKSKVNLIFRYNSSPSSSLPKDYHYCFYPFKVEVMYIKDEEPLSDDDDDDDDRSLICKRIHKATLREMKKAKNEKDTSLLQRLCRTAMDEWLQRN